MNLRVTLGTVREQGLPQRLCRGNRRIRGPTADECKIVAHQVAAFALRRATVRRMPVVTPQTEKCRRLMQQVVGHRAVRVMAISTALRHRRVFPHERAFLVCVTLETQLIQRFGLETAVPLSVTVVAIGTDNLALLDRMVRRQRSHAENLGMAPVTRRRLVDAHGAPILALNSGVADPHGPLDMRMRMGVVTVGTGNAFARVEGRMPGHRGRSRVAVEAEIGAGRRRHPPVRLVACRAVEVVRSQQLVRAGNLLELLRFRVATIAGSRLVHRHGSAGLGMSRVAIGTTDARQVMLRAMKVVHLRAIVTLQAQVLAS